MKMSKPLRFFFSSKLSQPRASLELPAGVDGQRCRYGRSKTQTLRRDLECEDATLLHVRLWSMAGVWYMTLNYSSGRVACQKLKQFREPSKCIGTQVHFEVTSDLLLEREIRPIIHLKKHLNIFTFCKEKRKVYSSGVYYVPEYSLRFDIACSTCSNWTKEM